MILLIEQVLQDSLRNQIEKSTGWPVTHVESFSAGLHNMIANVGQVKVAVWTVDDVDIACRGLKIMSRLSVAGKLQRPLVLALSNKSQPPSIADELERLGGHLLLRKYPEQVLETIKKLQWQARVSRGLPTIVIRRQHGSVNAVLAKYQAVCQDLHLGPRLRKLAEYFVVHAKTEHSTEALADALEISRQSVKEYLLRLRIAYDSIRQTLGARASGSVVFWTKRFHGGFVHGLKANVEIDDVGNSGDASFEIEGSAETVKCRTCRGQKPRSETTWSHLGWLCLDCCRELEAAGELS